MRRVQTRQRTRQTARDEDAVEENKRTSKRAAAVQKETSLPAQDPPIAPRHKKPAAESRSERMTGQKVSPPAQDSPIQLHKLLPQQKDKCTDVLKSLKRNTDYFVFAQPVDAELLGLHDYFNIVKNPMDLGTVGKKLEQGHYQSIGEFHSDVKLTFANAVLYNDEGTPVHTLAKEFDKEFEIQYKRLMHDVTCEQDSDSLSDDMIGGEGVSVLQNARSKVAAKCYEEDSSSEERSAVDDSEQPRKTVEFSLESESDDPSDHPNLSVGVPAVQQLPNSQQNNPAESSTRLSPAAHGEGGGGEIPQHGSADPSPGVPAVQQLPNSQQNNPAESSTLSRPAAHGEGGGGEIPQHGSADPSPNLSVSVTAAQQITSFRDGLEEASMVLAGMHVAQHNITPRVANHPCHVNTTLFITGPHGISDRRVLGLLHDAVRLVLSDTCTDRKVSDMFKSIPTDVKRHTITRQNKTFVKLFLHALSKATLFDDCGYYTKAPKNMDFSGLSEKWWKNFTLYFEYCTSVSPSAITLPPTSGIERWRNSDLGQWVDLRDRVLTKGVTCSYDGFNWEGDDTKNTKKPLWIHMFYLMQNVLDCFTVKSPTASDLSLDNADECKDKEDLAFKIKSKKHIVVFGGKWQNYIKFDEVPNSDGISRIVWLDHLM